MAATANDYAVGRRRRGHRLTARVATLLTAAAVTGDGSHVLELTEANFDELLREVPVALVAYVSPTSELHYPNLLPVLRTLAAAYEYAGIGIGRVPSTYTELLDRFGVDSFPTLHWMDGSRKWPYYACEATPERYSGPRGYEALAEYVQAKTNIPPRLPGPAAETEDTAAAATVAAADEARAQAAMLHAAVHGHDCAAPSASYRACLQHKPADWHHRSCAIERHEYLLCMSGRWAVHPDHHQELAHIYGQRFASVDDGP